MAAYNIMDDVFGGGKYYFFLFSRLKLQKLKSSLGLRPKRPSRLLNGGGVMSLLTEYANL